MFGKQSGSFQSGYVNMKCFQQESQGINDDYFLRFKLIQNNNCILIDKIAAKCLRALIKSIFFQPN